MRFLKTAAMVLAGTITAFPVSAQSIDFGKAAYDRNCAVCHGETGEGDGPVTGLFTQQPKNLRLLAEENNGAFPFSEVYQAIKGRGIRAHGSEMPIWGDIFEAEALPRTMHPGVSADEIVQGRILNIVYYLQTIQD